MNKKSEKIRKSVEDIFEQTGEEDAVLIVAHTNESLGCVCAERFRSGNCCRPCICNDGEPGPFAIGEDSHYGCRE